MGAGVRLRASARGRRAQVVGLTSMSPRLGMIITILHFMEAAKVVGGSASQCHGLVFQSRVMSLNTKKLVCRWNGLATSLLFGRMSDRLVDSYACPLSVHVP